jgi:hypothetical protein
MCARAHQEADRDFLLNQWRKMRQQRRVVRQRQQAYKIIEQRGVERLDRKRSIALALPNRSRFHFGRQPHDGVDFESRRGARGDFEVRHLGQLVEQSSEPAQTPASMDRPRTPLTAPSLVRLPVERARRKLPGRQ